MDKDVVRKGAWATTFAVSLAAITFASSFADSPNKISRSASEPYKRDPVEFAMLELQKAPSLPNLPDYTGHVVEFRGQVFPTRAKGKCYNLRFQVAENAADIRQWYQSAFQMYGWNIDYTTDNQLVARRGRNVCTIVIQGSTLAGRSTSFVQHYVVGYSNASDSS